LKPGTKYILIIVGLLICGFLTLSFVIRIGARFYKPATPDEIIAKEVKAMNKTTPIMIDSLTRFDSVRYFPNDGIMYYYSFVNVEKIDVDVDYFDSTMHPELLEQIKTEDKYHYLKKLNLTFIYRFSYEDGQWIHDINVTPKQYNLQPAK
jgi:hypothetical protein